MKICKFPDCSKKHKGKGYCNGHYTQLQKYNYDESKLALLGLRSIPKFCKFVDPDTKIKCNKKYEAKGYCVAHYQQLSKNNFDKSKLKPLWDRSNRNDYYNKVLENYPELKTKKEIDRRHEVLGITNFHNPSFHEHYGRWKINIFYNNSNKRTGQNFARHLTELKECRILKSDGSEDIDHIDEDKQNDHIDNLQILTNVENVIKTRKHKHGNYYKAIYEFICPMCGESTEKRLSEVNSNWKHNQSGPTCSNKCGSVFTHIKSFTNNKFKSTNDNTIGRFIEGKETKEDKKLIQLSLKDLEIVKKWRLYFKDKKEHFYQLIKTYYKQDNIRVLDNSEINLCLKLLSRCQEDLVLYDDFYKLFRTETINWSKEFKIKFLVEALYRFNSGNNNSDMAYKLYKYFDL